MVFKCQLCEAIGKGKGEPIDTLNAGQQRIHLIVCGVCKKTLELLAEVLLAYTYCA